MYPYPVVMIGPADSLPGLEHALTESAAQLVGRYPDLRRLRAARAGAEPATYLVRLQNEDDLVHLRQLADAFPGEPIVGLVEGECDTATLLRLNRAGAAQLVLTPLVPADLMAALDRAARQFGRIPPLGRVVSVCGVIGGAGTTTLAVTLALELAAQWKKTAILAEPLAAISHLSNHFPVEERKPATDLYFGPTDPDLAMMQNSLTLMREGVRAVLAPPPSLPQRRPTVGRVAAMLAASRHIVESILVDLPEVFTDDALAVIDRSDDVLFLSDTSFRGLQTLQHVLGAFGQRPGAARIHAVLNRFAKPDGFDKPVLCDKLGVTKVWTVAYDPSGFAAAEEATVPLREASVNSAALHDVRRLGVEIFGQPLIHNARPTMFRRLLHV